MAAVASEAPESADATARRMMHGGRGCDSMERSAFRPAESSRDSTVRKTKRVCKRTTDLESAAKRALHRHQAVDSAAACSIGTASVVGTPTYCPVTADGFVSWENDSCAHHTITGDATFLTCLAVLGRLRSPESPHQLGVRRFPRSALQQRSSALPPACVSISTWARRHKMLVGGLARTSAAVLL